MAQSGQKTTPAGRKAAGGRSGAGKTAQKKSASRRARPGDDVGIIPILARAVREVENAAARGKVSPANRTKFQVSALLMRDERARARADSSISDAERIELLKRLDGIATILAKTAARDTTLIQLLSEEAKLSDAARKLRRDMLIASGTELSADELIIVKEPEAPAAQEEKQVVPQSVRQAQMANPFLAPDLSAIQAAKTPQLSRLANWELLDPLFRAFEHGAGGGAATMDLPEAASLTVPGSPDLMRHQARLLAEVKKGHRTFLVADEPGLGKTAEALLAASVSHSYPFLAVVPNVVKTNWAREVELWTPHRTATVVHGDGNDVDAFSDVVIVNYEVLDRHVGWLGRFGFKGMVVDEAHFI
ncbi:MAG: DEAD/DEAH box helicase, partial [Salinibacterium sp.]|nr:DEAD/DEAH box helicase [Salinibacterium sp.]